MNGVRKILIVKLSAIGDIIHALPVARGLKQAFPQAFIGWLVSRQYQDILDGNPDINQIFIFERERWRGARRCLSRYREIWRLAHQIRAHRFDVVLDLQGLLRSAIFTLLSGADKRIGFANAREMAPLFYNDKLVVADNLHAVDRYGMLAEKLIGAPFPREFSIALTDEHRCYAKKMVGHRPFVVLVPGARWPSKRWPPCYFAQLADDLGESCGAQLAVVGAKSDVAIAETISRQAKYPEKIIDLTGKTSLKQLVAIIELADLVISNDSGPLHIAAAMGTPTIAIFGPTDLAKTGPYGDGHISITPDLPCRPCRTKQCRRCPSCMEEISVTQVAKAAWQILCEQRQK